MKSIITAIGKKDLNEELKKRKEFHVVNSDIQYQEGIIEVLESKKKIDLLILSNSLQGNIKIIDLIDQIRKINNKIEIIFITDKINEELILFLKNKKIKYIYYENKITTEDIINFILNKKEKNNLINLNKEKINSKKTNKKIKKEKTIKNKKKLKNKINYLFRKKFKKNNKIKNIKKNKELIKNINIKIKKRKIYINIYLE